MTSSRAYQMQGQAGETRDRILKAARVVMAERGFDNASTRLIAEAAGVPTGLVFYYFKTKELLLEATLGADTIVDAIERAFVAFRNDDDALAEITDVGLALFEWLDGNRELAHILFREIASHRDIARRIREVRENALAMLEHGLSRHVAAGRLRPFHTGVAVQALASAIMMAVIVDRPADPASYVAELMQLLFSTHAVR